MSTPDLNQAGVAYVYENVEIVARSAGWIVGVIQFGGGGTARPRDGVAYVYENVD